MATLSSIIPPVSLSTVSGTLPVGNGGTGVTASTGTTAVVLSNSPTLVSPILGSARATKITNAVGSEIDPSYTFTGNITTGMYHPSSGNIAFTISAVERMRINSDGVTCPAAIGGTAASSTLTVQSTSGVGTSDAIIFKTGSQVEQFRILTGGGITSANLVDAVGYKGLPQNSQTASYTLALADIGKMINITTGGVVIPANDSVAFPIGATIVVFNNSGSSQTISITTDTLRLAGAATTGSRTLAQYGLATLVKVTSTSWVATGNVT